MQAVAVVRSPPNPDRSPDIMEDQVTYPIVSAMLGAPRVKAVRGFSDFGYSYVYIIFEDGTDLYWARSRTLEYLSKILPRLPPEVKTETGPDATGVGWVFQYALVSPTRNLAELRSTQDWFLRYQLQAVPGVAEVAPRGGFVRQYQVKRIRPKFMTVATMFVGLAPIMWSAGAGADVMKRIAAPMIGGIFTSFLPELVVCPALYEVWKWRSVKRQVA